MLDNSVGDRVGLLAFAGSSFLVCPLTDDHAIVRQMLAELGPESIPKGGSSLASALVEAERAFRGTPAGGRVLLVISDGEDHIGEIAPALERLRRGGVTVIAALAGTPEGGLIPLADNTFVKDRSGAVVKSRSRRATMQMLDRESVTLEPGGSSLRTLLERARGESRASSHQQRRRKLSERFQYPLSLAIILFSIHLLMYRRCKR
jgi:Ca-activated chloride channel family protein